MASAINQPTSRSLLPIWSRLDASLLLAVGGVAMTDAPSGLGCFSRDFEVLPSSVLPSNDCNWFRLGSPQTNQQAESCTDLLHSLPWHCKLPRPEIVDNLTQTREYSSTSSYNLHSFPLQNSPISTLSFLSIFSTSSSFQILHHGNEGVQSFQFWKSSR